MSTEALLSLSRTAPSPSWLAEYSWLSWRGAQFSGCACRMSTSMDDADDGWEKTSSMPESPDLWAPDRLNCPRELLAIRWRPPGPASTAPAPAPRPAASLLETWRMSHDRRGGTAVAASGGGCAMGMPRRTDSTAAWQSCQFPDHSKPTEPYTGLSMRPQASYRRDRNIAVHMHRRRSSHEHGAGATAS